MNDVTIIGSGPAGLTAAIYLARASIKPVLYTGLQPGGQLTITTDIENYPGFRNGVKGPELMDEMTAQAQRFGTEILYESINKVDFSKQPFKLWSDSGEVLSRTVIISTGATARKLGLPIEEKYSGKGISYCATCDGNFFKGKVVAVIGGGDTALEEASYLSHLCAKVYLIHRRDKFRASEIMVSKVRAKKNIEIITPFVMEDVIDSGGNFAGLVLKHAGTNRKTELKLDGLFVAIGHTPNTEIFEPFLELDENKYLVVRDFVKTKVPGIFAAGDVADPVFRQAVTAAGMGCQAALMVQKFLEEGK